MIHAKMLYLPNLIRSATFFFLCGANSDSSPSPRATFPRKLQKLSDIAPKLVIMSTEVAAAASTSQSATAPPQGMRKNGLFNHISIPQTSF